MARIASFLVGGMKWLEEKALALLPFPLAAAKNTGAPTRLSASQKVYTKSRNLFLDAQNIIWKDWFELK